MTHFYEDLVACTERLGVLWWSARGNNLSLQAIGSRFSVVIIGHHWEESSPASAELVAAYGALSVEDITSIFSLVNMQTQGGELLEEQPDYGIYTLHWDDMGNLTAANFVYGGCTE